MRSIFTAAEDQRFFEDHGYLVFDLLGRSALEELWSLYEREFASPRDLTQAGRDLPYYISVFDADPDHKRLVDRELSERVRPRVDELMRDYRVFYSNFMIKFPGDGQIEAHQDFNFVDETRHTAFNLWSPLVDTTTQNGGLFVIPGSHRVFRTQRGPNIPQALTQYNDLLKRYARFVPLERGRGIVFDHRLIHFSPPNVTDSERVAIQSVLTPREATTVHYVFDASSERVQAYEVDKETILERDLWQTSFEDRAVDHQQDLIPLLDEREAIDRLAALSAERIARPDTASRRPVLADGDVDHSFAEQGFVKLRVLDADTVERLLTLYRSSTGGEVDNTDYGMYIGLEDRDVDRKRALVRRISETVLPHAEPLFRDCKPHLGSFLVKVPEEGSFTYPHQDWTFVDAPPFTSVTLWIALVDTTEENGALGFVPGSHRFFDHPIGSPSPDFRTPTQGHEAIFYEYLQFVPLKAGEAIAFDNRTIHGATPNLGRGQRVAVAIGMTPREADLHHYFLVPGQAEGGRRRIAKLAADPAFFETFTVAGMKELYDAGRMPDGYEPVETFEEEFLPFSPEEIRALCRAHGLSPNGLELRRSPTGEGASTTPEPPSLLARLRSLLARRAS